jgi:hypothetical protein
MKSFNLSQIVDFPTRITNNMATLIDCIFLDTMLVKKVISYPHINGLSDHDAQIVILDSFMIKCHKNISKKRVHSSNNQTLNNFLIMLQEENWDSVSNTNNIYEMFNNFQNTLIRNFNNSFPVITKGNRRVSANWITNGIKISCNRKRQLYLLRRNSNNPQVINFYNTVLS